MKIISLTLLFGLLCACGGNSVIEQDSAYDGAFESVFARYHLPGLAIGVIENGKVVYVRTAGELTAGGGASVTRETLFKIASNSKAMTASVLARLVDAGKLDWDDPVVEHLPQFRMLDPWVSANIEVRDLLVHNSGLPQGAGDLMLWPEPNSFTRDDILAGLAHLKPAYSFRSGYAYDNLLYVVAGEVAAAVGGASYEDLVHREVFEPLGLDCRVGEWRRANVDNVAQPHMRVGDRNVVVRQDEEIVPAITSAAAGGIRCSLDAMLKWAGNWLEPDAGQLEWLSEEQREAIWTPRTIMPIGERQRDWNNTHFYAYAFGFRLADVDGVWTVSHTGTLMGMYSLMMLLPDRNSGYVILINGEGSKARTALNEVLLDHFIAPEEKNTVAWYADVLDRPASAAETAPDTSSRQPATPQSMRNLTGTWRDPWFGDVDICVQNREVRFSSAKSPRLTGTVMQVSGRRLVDWDDDSVDAEAWLDFEEMSAGETVLRMSKVDPGADFSFDYEDLSFTRIRECG